MIFPDRFSSTLRKLPVCLIPPEFTLTAGGLVSGAEIIDGKSNEEGDSAPYCAIECARTAGCVGFNADPEICQLFSEVTGVDLSAHPESATLPGFGCGESSENGLCWAAVLTGAASLPDPEDYKIGEPVHIPKFADGTAVPAPEECTCLGDRRGRREAVMVRGRRLSQCICTDAPPRPPVDGEDDDEEAVGEDGGGNDEDEGDEEDEENEDGDEDDEGATALARSPSPTHPCTPSHSLPTYSLPLGKKYCMPHGMRAFQRRPLSPKGK